MAEASLRAAALEPGGLWLSRPPFLLLARILAPGADGAESPGEFRYEVLDHDGVSLTRASGRLDADWLYCFQPLTRRHG